MQLRGFLSVLSGLSLSVLAACGQPGSETAPLPTPPALEACTLMTIDDADPGGQLGLVPVRAPIELPIGQDNAKCSYGTAEPPIMVVSLEVRRLPSAAAARREQRGSEGMLGTLSGSDPQEVPGVGERAMWAGGRVDQLHVLAGEMRLIVTIEVGEESERLERARAIAQSALERLLKPAPATTTG
jgi:hypothetical protein